MAIVSNGTTLIDNGALDSGVPTGSLILLETQTASASASIEFTSGIDSTYDSYVFKFINIHPATDGAEFQVNFRDGGSSFDAVKTTIYFRSRHFENGSSGSLNYLSGFDLAQSTSSQSLALAVGSDNDQSCVGTLTLFAPSSITFVKHFIARIQEAVEDDQSRDQYVAGYCNTTNAIDGVQFSMSSGNIDSGIIKMYGVK
jgi:hypothetical protein